MLEFINVTKVYPGHPPAVSNLDLEVAKGEFLVLIGPSGCGKTTTLKMVNRLVKHTSGTIRLWGRDIGEFDDVHIRRSIGYVIQQIGLFPHLTIADNIGIVPRLLKWRRPEIEKRVDALLELVHMDPAMYRKRYPRELSGGQQQRIGVLRALAAEPDIILMDEPFGALDPITRESLQDELKNLQMRLRKTIVFVTHDIDEALKLGDRIVIMRSGEVLQEGTPEDILRHPAGEFVERFIGKDRLASRPEDLTVAQVAVDAVVTAPPDFGLAQAVALMQHKHVDSLVITGDDGVFLGMVSVRDIENCLLSAQTVQEIMRRDVPTAHQGASAKKAFDEIFLGKAGILPVLDDRGRLAGIVTKARLADVLSRTIWNSKDDREIATSTGSSGGGMKKCR
ncbi:MAG: ABC transporter ATP-binding protein [Ignavibacteriales bacterium]